MTKFEQIKPHIDSLIDHFKSFAWTPDTYSHVAIFRDCLYYSDLAKPTDQYPNLAIKICFLVDLECLEISCEITPCNSYKTEKRCDYKLHIDLLKEMQPVIDKAFLQLRQNIPDKVKINPYCALNNLEHAEYLEYADPNSIDPFGNNELLKLAKNILNSTRINTVDCILTLIQRGADPCASDSDGRTVIDILQEKSNLREYVKAAIESFNLKIEIDDQDDHGLGL